MYQHICNLFPPKARMPLQCSPAGALPKGLAVNVHEYKSSPVVDCWLGIMGQYWRTGCAAGARARPRSVSESAAAGRARRPSCCCRCCGCAPRGRRCPTRRPCAAWQTARRFRKHGVRLHVLGEAAQRQGPEIRSACLWICVRVWGAGRRAPPGRLSHTGPTHPLPAKCRVRLVVHTCKLLVRHSVMTFTG